MGLDNASIKIYISVNLVNIMVYVGNFCNHNLRINEVSQRMGKDKSSIKKTTILPLLSPYLNFY